MSPPSREKRKDYLRRLWDRCEGHVWEQSEAIIDTSPPTLTFFCRRCGAATHDPQAGEYCFTRHFGQGIRRREET